MQQAPVQVLFVGDHPLVDCLATGLADRGHSVTSAKTASAGRTRLGRDDFEVAVIDAALPQSGALVLLPFVRERLAEAIVVGDGGPTAPWLTAGAFGCTPRTAPLAELEAVVLGAAQGARLRRENATLRTRLDPPPHVIARHPSMRQVVATLQAVPATTRVVVLEGEAGTGKRLLARLLHRANGRAGDPFVHLPALPGAGDAASEAGIAAAVTHARAGVLYVADLDEAADDVQASLELAQPTLVKALARVPSPPLLVCGTRARPDTTLPLHADLLALSAGSVVSVPPLRDRGDDLRLLARHFLERGGTSSWTISDRALALLRDHSWPGNVQELRLVMDRARFVATGRTVDARDLPLDLRDPSWQTGIRVGLTLAEMEREYIRAVLRENGGHRGRTAEALGIDPKTLYNKLGAERRHRS